jgi:hypothetical protein
MNADKSETVWISDVRSKKACKRGIARDVSPVRRRPWSEACRRQRWYRSLRKFVNYISASDVQNRWKTDSFVTEVEHGNSHSVK